MEVVAPRKRLRKLKFARVSWRRSLKQIRHYFSPSPMSFFLRRGERISSPLGLSRQRRRNILVDDAELIADALIKPNEKEPHWTDNARAFLKMLILYVVTQGLGAVHDLLTFHGREDASGSPVPALGRDEATGPPGAAKERFRRRAFDARIDRLSADLDVFRPHRHEAPAHRLVNTTAFFRHDNAHILRRRDVPGRFQVRNGLIREVIKRHKLGPGECLRETPAHACLPSIGWLRSVGYASSPSAASALRTSGSEAMRAW